MNYIIREWLMKADAEFINLIQAISNSFWTSLTSLIHTTPSQAWESYAGMARLKEPHIGDEDGH